MSNINFAYALSIFTLPTHIRQYHKLFFYLNGIYFLLLAIVTVMDKVINEFMHFSISRASNMTEVSPIPGLSLLAEYDDINRCNSVLNDTAAEECNVFFNKMLYYV